VFLEVAEAI